MVLAPVRARDLRANIKEHGFEQGVTITMERLLEEQSAMRITLRELASMLAQCIDQVANMVTVGDAMGAEMKEIRRRAQQSDDINQLPPSNG